VDQEQVQTELEMQEDIVHLKEITQALAAAVGLEVLAREQRAAMEHHQILQVHV
jgi:hypothetical protein